MNAFEKFITTDMTAWELLAEFQKPEAATPPKDTGNNDENGVT